MDYLSQACLALPPITASNYEPKGEQKALSGLDTYITGNPSSKKGIIDIYDVFGLMPQTIQGADRLAASLDAIVLIPDFFQGGAMNVDFVPADTDEKKASVDKFRKEKMNFPETLDQLIRTTTEAKQKWPSVEAWAVFGLCWGGKIATLASGEGTLFKCSGQAHPGRMTKEDAEKMVIPHICLASHDEPVDVVKDYKAILGAKGEVETYDKMFHGWMGAKANLEDAENAKEFERGYNQVAQFFAKHL